ncbi:MAG: T9SS type A sorting domain-containing protein [Bacteroidia bacterium]
MIKQLLLPGLLFSSLTIFSQAFTASYPFSAVTASSGVTDPTPPPTATGVTFGSFTAVGVSANSSAASRFSFDTWGTGATTGVDTYSTMTGSLSVSKYYGVTITPAGGYGVSLTSMAFDVRRSGTGIRNFAVRSDADGYTANLTPSIVATQTNISVVGSNIFFWNFDATSTSADQRGCSIVFSGPAFTSFTVARSLRFYAWNAEAGTGTFSIDSVRIYGTATIGAGVAELTHDLNAGFKLYPNPSNDGVLYLESKNTKATKVEVLNMLGAVVAVKELAGQEESAKVRLDLNLLPSGSYFVRMGDGAVMHTERFFITK